MKKLECHLTIATHLEIPEPFLQSRTYVWAGNTAQVKFPDEETAIAFYKWYLWGINPG